MMNGDAQPVLRLVGVHGATNLALGPNVAETTAIARENRQAARNPTLEPTDPRWVLAVRTRTQLQGAVLTPEKRERLMRLANLMGLRPFDANVVIAVVQDAARRGEPLSSVTDSLSVLPKADPSRHRQSGLLAWRWVVAILAALIANLLLIQWLTG